jgi:hypothetical protein
MVALNLFAARKNSSIGSWASTQRIFCGILQSLLSNPRRPEPR